MRVQVQGVASGVTGAQSPIGLNTYAESFVYTVQVQLVSGSATFTVEYTAAPLDQTTGNGTTWTAANALWTATSISAATSSSAATITAPSTFVRLNVSASTNGVIRFLVLQSGGTK